MSKQLDLEGNPLEFDMTHVQDYKGIKAPSEKATIEALEKKGYTVISIGLPDLLLLTDKGIRWLEVKSNLTMPIRQSQLITFQILKEHGMDVDIYYYEENKIVPFNCGLAIPQEQITSIRFLKNNYPKRKPSDKLMEALSDVRE